jgi:hypothetical protein
MSYTLVGCCVWHQQAILVAYTNTTRFSQLRVRDKLSKQHQGSLPTVTLPTSLVPATDVLTTGM